MHLPAADSSRIIVGSWWLVVLVITTTYCGNLVAFLTFPKIDIPIRTIEDILEHRDTITWSIANNSYFEKELKVSGNNFVFFPRNFPRFFFFKDCHCKFANFY